MVNAVNSARSVPELGARRDNAPGQAETPVQDVRKEAARLIERHKRRLAETALVSLGPQRPLEDTLMALRLKQAAAGATLTPTAPAADRAGAGADAVASLLVADGHGAKRPPAQSVLTAAVRNAGDAQTGAAFAAEASHAPVIVPDAGQADSEGRMPQYMADQAKAALSEDVREQVLAQQSQANVKPSASEAQSLPQPASTAAQALRTSAERLPLHAGAATGEPRNGATVFDVPLRGLGAQHSTQVSLHLASGQVVLTPSSERAAEVLISAAQATDWVSVGDATDERGSSQRERESDDEDGQ